MPFIQGKDKDGCWIKYGASGHKYYHICNDKEAAQRARDKAQKQAIAEHINGYSALINFLNGKYANEKISFDYDDTLTKSNIQAKAKNLVDSGADVYIISARNDKAGMEPLAKKLGILDSRIYATGSNKAKVEKVKSLGIDKHYDNNPDVINQLPKIGHLVT